MMNNNSQIKNALTARFADELRLGIFRNSRAGGVISMNNIIRLSDFAEIEVRSSKTLGSSHLDIFLGLCRLATVNGVERMEYDDPLFSAMKIDQEDQDGKKAQKIVIQLSLRQIAKVSGRSAGGKGLDDLNSALEDLASVILICRWVDKRKRKRRYVSSLIGLYQVDDKLSIGFHSLLGASISGSGFYSSVNWLEREKIKSKVGRFMHAMLSSRVQAGKTIKLRTETIYKDVFGDEEVSRQESYERKKKFDAGLIEIKSVGWQIEEVNESTRSFCRPALESADETPAPNNNS